jgi:hypothetical protein
MQGFNSIGADLRHKLAEREDGLLLPQTIVEEDAEKQAREEALAEIERRRKGPRDRLVRRDGRKRKATHTQSRYRSSTARRKGLKGVTGA